MLFARIRRNPNFDMSGIQCSFGPRLGYGFDGCSRNERRKRIPTGKTTPKTDSGKRVFLSRESEVKNYD
jgi:hypothetical protein